MRGINMLFGILTVLTWVGLVIGLLAVLMVVGIVQAGIVEPLPIAVKIQISEDSLADFYKVSIENERTGEVVSGTTNQYMEYLVDWANSKLGYEEGDIFKIRVKDYVKEVKYVNKPPTQLRDVYTGEPIDIIYFNIEKGCECIQEKTIEIEKECPICPVCPECEKCPEDTTPYAKCDSCCQPCPECKKCPEPMPMESLLLLILAFFGIGFGSGTYGYKFVIRRRKDTGKIEAQVTQHKHYGCDRYHSIYTVHRDEKIRHPKGCKNPVYDKGRYIKCADRGD